MRILEKLGILDFNRVSSRSGFYCNVLSFLLMYDLSGVSDKYLGCSQELSLQDGSELQHLPAMFNLWYLKYKALCDLVPLICSPVLSQRFYIVKNYIDSLLPLSLSSRAPFP